jgi:hypothetical protein
LAPTKVVSVAVKFGELKIEGPWSARVQMPEVMHAERASRPELSSSVTSELGVGTQSTIIVPFHVHAWTPHGRVGNT